MPRPVLDRRNRVAPRTRTIQWNAGRRFARNVLYTRRIIERLLVLQRQLLKK
jgi:hypothetical protein